MMAQQRIVPEIPRPESLKEIDRIVAALPFDFVRRMWNWVRSRDGGSVATSRLEEQVDFAREEHSIPVMLGEADDTHRAIMALPQRHQEVIRVFWTMNTKALEDMARATPRLRLWKLGKASFRVWLETAHTRLQDELRKQIKAERGKADDYLKQRIITR